MIILAAMLRMLADLPGRWCWPAGGQGDGKDGRAAVTLAGLLCGVCWPLAGCCADSWGSFGGYPGLECVAYVPTAAMFWMLADLPGGCCWPGGGPGRPGSW
ncbi:MAG: hypothetical protein KAJ19_27055 [Gammaproteobacteria bacterium]|nr:hypothetical protein [Gammaproteobacteria bacterium]